ncbi:hypothetical protein PSZ74_24255, partial [Shigella sonnei]|nr:hypothetical protein [Shigella sonnei]
CVPRRQARLDSQRVAKMGHNGIRLQFATRCQSIRSCQRETSIPASYTIHGIDVPLLPARNIYSLKGVTGRKTKSER